MRQAIHIFKKDVRHLWIEILLVLAANGLFALIHTRPAFWQNSSQLPQTVAAFFVSFLLPVAWWLLIVRAVHGETLTGDREFWPTRPYSWQSLLAAKLLFIAVFVNLPVFVAQADILQANGFPLSTELVSLLWNQVLLTLALFLPVAAIGALTTGLVQFLLVGLVTWAAMIMLSLRFSMAAVVISGGTWGPMEWIRIAYLLAVLALAVPAILVWQYAQRRTLAVRTAAAAVVLLVCLGAPLSWSQAFAIQSHFSKRAVPATIRAGWNTSFQWMTRALVRQGRNVDVNIPLALSGVPDDLVPKPEGVTFSLEAPGGALWRSGGVTSTGQLISLRSIIPDAIYRAVKDQPVTLRGEIYLTLYGDRRETKVPVRGPARMVRGMGLCSATGGPPATYFLSCAAGMQPRAEKVSITFEPHPRVLADFASRFPTSYSPFPAELSISPLNRSDSYSTYQGPLDAVTVSSEVPVAFVRAPLQIDGLRLAAYEVTMK
jgi:hypothetical protein